MVIMRRPPKPPALKLVMVPESERFDRFPLLADILRLPWNEFLPKAVFCFEAETLLLKEDLT